MMDEENAPLLPGQHLGGHELLALVSRGGMGEVWLAREPGAETVVALKTLLPTLERSAKMRLMFTEETRIATRLHHANVVRVLRAGEERSILYYTMEWVDGASLEELLREASAAGGRLPVAVVLHVVREVARGLHEAHELKDDAGAPLDIVHRDVSPSNVMIGRDGACKITDFGIARSRGRVAKTTTGGIRGKLLYLAPEQALAQELDRRVDVWGLTAVLYEALVGAPPHDGDDEAVILARIVTGPPTLALPPGVPRELLPILERGLAFAASERYPTAAALADDLDAVMAHLGLSASSKDVAAELERWLFPALQARAARVKSALRRKGTPASDRPAPVGRVEPMAAAVMPTAPSEGAARPLAPSAVTARTGAKGVLVTLAIAAVAGLAGVLGFRASASTEPQGSLGIERREAGAPSNVTSPEALAPENRDEAARSQGEASARSAVVSDAGASAAPADAPPPPVSGPHPSTTRGASASGASARPSSGSRGSSTTAPAASAKERRHRVFQPEDDPGF